MKLSLKLVFALLTASAPAAMSTLGCTADSSADAENAEDVEDIAITANSEDELSARSAQFVGDYQWRAGDSGEFVDFETLSLKSNGRYTAKVDSQIKIPGARCVRFPCTLPESGTWTTVKSGGQVKVKVVPTSGGSRSYGASIQSVSRTLTLTRYGKSTQLFSATPVLTCATVLCAAGTTCQMKPLNGGAAVPRCIPTPVNTCKRGGCSGQICAETSVISTCEWRPEYACYQAATCERQTNGTCGFTPTPALAACLASP